MTIDLIHRGVSFDGHRGSFSTAVDSTVASVRSGQEDATVTFSFDRANVRHLKIHMAKRVTKWGYSMWEIAWF